MSGEQKIRAFLFYSSLAIFFFGLPFILSFALGYKFDTRTLHFTKTGLIVLKTQPQGAAVYLDGKLLEDKTPATLNELLPGKYNVRLELEKYYPWSTDVLVQPGKVERLERVILFPLRSNIRQLNKGKVSHFWLDERKDSIYYVNDEEGVIYKSNMEGEDFRKAALLPKLNAFGPQRRWKISPDKDKLLLVTPHKLVIALLEAGGRGESLKPAVELDYRDRFIIDAFWHSDSYHIIMVTNRKIEVLEAVAGTLPVPLVNLNKRDVSASYDSDKDALYFIDSQKAADGKFYDNVYELELGSKFYLFQELIKPRHEE